MAFQYSSLQGTEVTISGAVTVSGFPTEVSSQTMIHHLFATNNSATQIAYTVPAGKTFYLYGITHNVGNATANVSVFETNGTTKVFEYAQLANDNKIIVSPFPLAKYLENTYVKVTATSGSFQIFGVLVNN